MKAFSLIVPICLFVLYCFESASTDTTDVESAPVLPPVLPKPIVGGQAVAIQSAPWQLSLRSRAAWKTCKTNRRGRRKCNVRNYGSWQHICGASLIGSMWVVTAKHCVEDIPAGFKAKHVFHVVAGITYQSESGTAAVVDKIFYSNTPDEDFALLKLANPIEDNPPKIQAIAVPPVDLSFAGQWCNITGWGVTETGYASNVLKSAEVFVRENDYEDCQIFGWFKVWDVCVQDPVNGYTACNGDSGGPLACYKDNVPYLLGSTFKGAAGCPLGYPNVYTRVPYFKSTIDSTIAANS